MLICIFAKTSRLLTETGISYQNKHRDSKLQTWLDKPFEQSRQNPVQNPLS
jgi:hypothetical protein